MVEERGERSLMPISDDLKEALGAVIGQSFRPLVSEKGEKSPLAASNEATSVFIKPISAAAWHLSTRPMGWRERQNPPTLEFLSPRWNVYRDETGSITGVVFNEEVVLFRGGGVGTPFKKDESVVPQNLVVRR